MKAGVDLASSVPTSSDSWLFVGRFVRRQGQYGTVAVVGRIDGAGVEALDDAKRLFPRDGLVETHGLTHHKGLAAGDWVEFDVARNTRPGAPEYKVAHLRRLPRYAVLPEASFSSYRVLLTSEGWHGDRRPGVWALRVSGDKVLIVELEAGKDRALRIPRTAANAIRWCRYHEEAVVRLQAGSAAEMVFTADLNKADGRFDWSDEADHVARVIRALSDANDPRVEDIITWLDLHHEEGTGRVFAATVDHEAAEAALRSGELADRLRADRSLMKAYLDAALQDDAVRDAVAAYAREGHGEERARLREELLRELAVEKERTSAELATEMERLRADAEERLQREIAELGDAQQKDVETRQHAAEEALSVRIEELDREFGDRRAMLQEQLAQVEANIASTRSAAQAAEAELAQVRSDADAERARLRDTIAEIDRWLAISDRLGPPNASASAQVANRALRAGVGRIFPERAKVSVGVKGQLISQQVLLTDAGKDLFRRLAVLLLSGELPIIFGPEAVDLLRLAEALLSPGRFAAIEADPTLISIDDLWARPGSGAPTLMASAAAAAGAGGAVLVAIKGIERSGARFWVPALADVLRGGGLPRGLLVCCVVNDRDHDEIAALPKGSPLIKVEGVFTKGGHSFAPTLLSAPQLDLSALDPGPMPEDLSPAGPVLFELGFEPDLGLAMRAARMFVEAKALLGEEAEAKRVVIAHMRSIAGQAG
ncbi:hypothetical protein ACFW16_28310 [Inquilinus sp. NPDC058860]|uniref:hypothetical protein n=1 Tax=Inquilinus sp. NPDC058860 TaxID=3346652 RepID=UPI003689C5BD